MTWTPDRVFMLSILAINASVWILLAIPKNRKKLPKTYLIARSWLWMLATLFFCFYLSSMVSTDNQHRTYWWVIDSLLIIIGLRGLFEILRLWCSKNKIAFVEKLELLNLQPTSEPTQLTDHRLNQTTHPLSPVAFQSSTPHSANLSPTHVAQNKLNRTEPPRKLVASGYLD